MTIMNRQNDQRINKLIVGGRGDQGMLEYNRFLEIYEPISTYL